MSEYNEVVGDLEAVDSNHPVLHKLKQEIADAKNQEQYWRGQYSSMSERFNEYRQNVQNVLVQSLEDHDKETIEHIAGELEVSLIIAKSYRVIVTFTVDVEEEHGVEFNPEWDLDFSVGSNTNSVEVIDYSTDVVSHNEE